VTIALGYFREGRQDEHAAFDLFYRTQPFQGTFAVFAGLQEAIQFIMEYKVTEEELVYLRENLPGVPDGFIDYLRNVDLKKLTITAFPEGSIVFPREPLMRVEGPIAYCQLVETPLLNCINFPTLMATNALRFRLHAPQARLMEFGLRRAQGPDGAMSASRYSYIAGFDGTSNVLAGRQYNIPIFGTVAHSFVMSFRSVSQLSSRTLAHAQTGEPIDMWAVAQQYVKENGFRSNEAELVAFVSQAITFPYNFLALVDSYDTLKSGIPNFLAASLALDRAGYRGKGVRLDSGDLGALSKAVRQMFIVFAERYDLEYAKKFIITASNDINEDELIRLAAEGHEINSYGIGTHLVTCQKQPALGGVYKLVEINGVPRVKVSNSVEKSSLPAKKNVFRLYDADGLEVADLLTELPEDVRPGTVKAFRVYPDAGPVTVEVAKVVPLLVTVWEGGAAHVDDIPTVRQRVLDARKSFNPAVLAVVNSRPYQVLISERLYITLDALIKALGIE
jgi:nicotinate phosphoribosyltransferase